MRRGDRILAGAAFLWIAFATAIELGLFGLGPATLGSSPDTLVEGQFWHLFTSSLLVDGAVPVLQMLLVILLTVAVLAVHGAPVWWAAALLGHVGSALLAYGAIGIAIALGNGAADATADDWDYGISCVMAAQFGVLAGGALIDRRRGTFGRLDAFFLVIAALALVTWFAAMDWYGIEHPLAFLIGIAVVWFAERRR